MQPYLNGMAEAASELRRQVLDCLRRDEGAEAERLLALMDEVYGLLVTIDYPDALTGGLRRSTDALARGARAHPRRRHDRDRRRPSAGSDRGSQRSTSEPAGF